MTAFDNLLASRREHLAARHLDLPVPGYDRVFVRYGVVDPEWFARRWKARKASAKSEPAWEYLLNVDLLIACCKGIYLVTDEGKQIGADGSDGEWPTFSHGLADLLEVEPAPVTGVVRALFASAPLAVGEHADRLIEWSGARRRDADEEWLEGEAEATAP